MSKLTYLCITFFTISFNLSAQKANPKLALEVVDGFFKNPVESNFMNPTGVAVNSKGQVHVLTLGSNNLMIFNKDGSYLKSLAQGLLVAPHGLRIDKDDNIWVTDLDQHMVLKLNAKGQLLMALGQRNTKGEYNEELAMGLFNRPADVSFGLNGEIYVADGYGNSRIAKFDKNGKYLKSWGVKGAENGQFDNPHNIITDKKGMVYVADRNNLRVQIFDKDGNYVTSWTHVGKPWGLTITNDETIFLADGTKGVIYKLNTKGKVLGEYKSYGKQIGQIMGGHGMATDSNGSIYITEVFNWRVEKFLIK